MKRLLRPLYINMYQIYNRVTNSNITIGYIFMLHRIGNICSRGIPANENMKISPNWLDSFLTLIESKYDIIRLEEVPERLNNTSNRPFVVFTFDDGYKDNFTQGLPIFKKHNAPFTIFLTTDFMDKKAILWWYVIEDLINQNECIELSDGTVYNYTNLEQKQDCFLQIRNKILSVDQIDLKSQIDSIFSKYNINWTQKCDELCLSWDDVIALKNEELVTLGAHTMHHYNLKSLATPRDVENEIMLGWLRLQEKAGLESDVFAYPFGSINEADVREFVTVEKLKKFKLALKAYGGSVTHEDSDLFSLPRIMLSESFSFSDLYETRKQIR